MRFQIVGSVRDVVTIAAGAGIRESPRLRKIYGAGWWWKRKGVATVELASRVVRTAEIHWYEATVIGQVEYKIKRFLD